MLYRITFVCAGVAFYSMSCTEDISTPEGWQLKCQESEELRADYLQIKPKRCIQIIDMDNNNIEAIFKN